jgi:hypothetical protein
VLELALVALVQALARVLVLAPPLVVLLALLVQLVLEPALPLDLLLVVFDFDRPLKISPPLLIAFIYDYHT